MVTANTRKQGRKRTHTATVLAAVLTAAVVGCGDGGDGGQLALQGDAAVEASAGVAVSTIIALSEFRPMAVNPAGRDVCADGGESNTTCNVEDGKSRLHTTLSDCHAHAPDLGGTIFVNGSYASIVDDPSACADGPPAGAPITLEVRDYNSRLVDDSGDEVGSFSGTYTQTTAMRGEGCPGLINDSRVIDGFLHERSTLSGLDLALNVEHLALDVDSEGFPCEVSVVPKGRVTITDTGNQRQFTQVFGDARVTFRDGSAAISGDVANDCIGNVTFETIEGIYADRLDDCPTAGLVKVSFANGTTAAIRFTQTGGVDLDFNDDGEVDETVSNCHEAALAQCNG